MTRTPPNRRGIKFEVGAPLEARDNLKNWYVASIEKIDHDEERVLIHYRQWSHRYDEWFDWSSPYLRPVERIQLRKEGLRENSGGSLGAGNMGKGTRNEAISDDGTKWHRHAHTRFHMNDKVLASWSDCRFYPARVLSVNKDASYTVRFFDGVVQTVKEIHVKPFHRDRKGGKSKSEEKRKDKSQFRKKQHERNGRSPGGERDSTENGNVKSRRAQGSILDRAANGEGEAGAGKKRGMEEEEPAKVEDLGVETGKQTSGAFSGKNDGGVVPAREGGRRVLRELPGRPGAGEVNSVEVQEEGEPGGQSADASPLQELMEVKAEVEISEHLKAGLEDAPYQNRGRQTRPAEGAAQTAREVLELRKRKICLGQSPPSKRSKPDISTAKPGSVESKPAELDPPTATVAVPKVNRETLDTEGQTETPKPPTELGPDPPVQAPVVRKAQQPNPNKYSREPLYRVVKNQPPPVLSINLDHNPFKCRAPGCHKSFRKAKLLHYHVKYYHEGDEAAEADLSPPRSVQTRQEAALDTPRTRRTTSTHLSSSMNSTHRTLYPSRMGKLNERKRTLAPPGGGAGNRQRPSLQKSRENRMEKPRCKVLEREPNVASAARERAKEARIKDFLRIRLKKKKRKKRKRSKSEEDSGSDWSTDSPFWSQEELQELDAAAGVTVPGLASDVVRCICKVQEENDFMIQCEECLSWQHGACMGLMEDSVPERYTCYICRYLPGQRWSLHYRHDSDWLNRGHMYGLPFLEENYSDQNASKITAAHQLLGDVHHVIEVLNGLQLKISVLQSQSHPELQLWCQPWIRAEKPKKMASTEKEVAPPAALEDNTQDSGDMYHSTLVGGEKMGHAATQDSYISSEHCYQKPHAYYPATEQRLVVETRDSELEDSLRSTEDLLTLEHRYGVPLDPDTGKIQPSPQLEGPTNAKKADGCRKQSGDRGGQVKIEATEVGAAAEGSLQQQWQINLLDHIEAVQEEVTHRMDFIEKELDVLESWLDHTGELEPPEPLARLPQLKLRIKQLLTDLGKVQQIALCCST
ncbi:PHD finger protein 20-like isoform X2 [Brienomyrus brachyistius]|uniref:PHD finger protein 20-like isoform X2 n=1 Tax=Brienomyrus brachyistius TaxID=42636 RepID=UPI0020B2D8B6|nr:PHD finger protein 20-like isoform X2 [Brienomyrus brachyistius]